MFCEQCGKEMAKDSKFCTGCGAKTEPLKTTPETPAPVKTELIAPIPTVEPKAEKEQSTVNTIKVEQTVPYNEKNNLTKPLSIGAYIGMFILMSIPILNLIMLLVWSFSDTVNVNKKRFAIAILIMILIGIILGIAIGILTAILGAGFYRFYY